MARLVRATYTSTLPREVDFPQDLIGPMPEAWETAEQQPYRPLLLANCQPPASGRPLGLYTKLQNVSVQHDQPQSEFVAISGSRVGKVCDEVGAVEPGRVAVSQRCDLPLDPCMLIRLIKRAGWLLNQIGRGIG